MNEHDERSDEALLDLQHKTNEELRELIADLNAEEQRLSYRRRVLHGKIDILRTELVRRLKKQHDSGEDVISGHDVARLIDILASETRGVASVDVTEDTDEDDEA